MCCLQWRRREAEVGEKLSESGGGFPRLRKLGLKVVKSFIHGGTSFLFTCSDTFCCNICRLATMHSVTDGRTTDRQTDNSMMIILRAVRSAKIIGIRYTHYLIFGFGLNPRCIIFYKSAVSVEKSGMNIWSESWSTEHARPGKRGTWKRGININWSCIFQPCFFQSLFFLVAQFHVLQIQRSRESSKTCLRRGQISFDV